jgi:hypothetical protein
MEKQMNLIEWLEAWDNGKFTKDIDSMIDAGWWDWFCKDEALYNRTKRFVGLIRVAAKSPLIDPTKTGLFFKNNAPVTRGTYDSLSFKDLESGEQLYWITPNNTHSGQAEVYQPPFEDENQLMPKGATLNTIKKFFKDGHI